LINVVHAYLRVKSKEEEKGGCWLEVADYAKYDPDKLVDSTFGGRVKVAISV